MGSIGRGKVKPALGANILEQWLMAAVAGEERRAFRRAINGPERTSLAAETDESRDEKSRLKAMIGCPT
jgi:hypothetical protein